MLENSPRVYETNLLCHSFSSAFSLHPLQLCIAKRGAQLVESGGLMVYSTCSMSPIGKNLFDFFFLFQMCANE